jgi:leucyl aminopeptidase
VEFALRRNETTSTIIYPFFKDRLEQSVFASLPVKPYMGDKTVTTWFFGRDGKPHVLLVGLGESDKFQLDSLRAAIGAAGRAVNKELLTTAKVSFAAMEDTIDSGISKADAVTAVVEGWLLGTYAFDKYKSKKTERTVEVVHIELDETEDLKTAIQLGRVRAQGVMLARDLGNEPPNQLRPRTFAERIVERFKGTNVTVKVYEGEELEKQQFVGLLAVGKGSKYPPAMVEMHYCTDPSKPLIALVGKGMTFDSGGISLKSGRDISDMRMDMCGAAAVVGAMDILVKSGVKANVVALVATAENIPDAGSMLPGELIQYPNGVSVQVGNTDAEGRLILADALIHAKNLGAVEVVDIATLTGACMAALGLRMAGVWGDEALVDVLRQVGHYTGDKVWHMPLEEEYEELLKSHYADTNNISSSPYGGAILAALFLRKFVDPSMKWAHVDMAGPMEAKSTKGYIPAGATGYGARLLADFVVARTNS